MKRIQFSYKAFIYLFFFLFSLLFILPLLLLVVTSFSTEASIAANGFSIIPRSFSLAAYQYTFLNPRKLVDAYMVTLGYAFIGTTASVAIMAMAGYALSRDGFAYKKIITWFLLVTMFFSGGTAPAYIINTTVFGLGNNFMIYLVSGLVNAYTVFVFKTFFAQLPKSLIESACLDGASEAQILTRVIVPLSRPVLATFFLFGLLSRWNNFEVSMYYITEPRLYSIQRLLQQVLQDAKIVKEMAEKYGVQMGETPPYEIMKFSICILAAVPMLVAFPFFQKYFSKGMVLGAVKG